jgi:uncharacterized membrane protein
MAGTGTALTSLSSDITHEWDTLTLPIYRMPLWLAKGQITMALRILKRRGADPLIESSGAGACVLGTCMCAWYVHVRLVRACVLGTCMCAWYVHVCLVRAYVLDACMCAWYVRTFLIRACVLGTCVRSWYVHVCLTRGCQHEVRRGDKLPICCDVWNVRVTDFWYETPCS